jgi:glucose uptake protein
MWMPSDYYQALLMLIISMICWGSWANALKLMGNVRFELFYWDYIFGTTAMSIVLALTLGSTGSSGESFFADLGSSSTQSKLFAFAGGVAFNVSNILLTGAIEVAGLAVAFPVGVGLSIIIGVLLSYWITPKNDPIMLFGGVALLLVAIIVDARAYRMHRGVSRSANVRTGIILCIISGIGLGLFYPLVAKSYNSPDPLGPYAVGVLFMLGMLASNLVVNTAIMRKPVTGQPPLSTRDYFGMPARWHVLGFALGGAVWGLGTVLNFIASGTGLVGPATSFALGDGATMVAALWGVLVWREFRGATVAVRRLLVWMFVLFVLGLGSIALSPIIQVT